MHQAHTVSFNDESGEHYALVKSINGDGSKNLLVWHEVDGWVEKPNVPHGSPDQGYTYS